MHFFVNEVNEVNFCTNKVKGKMWPDVSNMLKFLYGTEYKADSES